MGKHHMTYTYGNGLSLLQTKVRTDCRGLQTSLYISIMLLWYLNKTVELYNTVDISVFSISFIYIIGDLSHSILIYFFSFRTCTTAAVQGSLMLPTSERWREETQVCAWLHSRLKPQCFISRDHSQGRKCETMYI